MYMYSVVPFARSLVTEQIVTTGTCRIPTVLERVAYMTYMYVYYKKVYCSCHFLVAGYRLSARMAEESPTFFAPTTQGRSFISIIK